MIALVRRLLPILLIVASVAIAAAGADEKKAPAKPALETKAAEKKAPAKPAAAKPATEENYCISCHGESDLWEGEQRRLYVTTKDLAGDIHWQKGLRCQDCHGGDPKESDFIKAHSQDAGFRSIKLKKDIPKFCGDCHSNIKYMKQYQPSPRTDQLAEYVTSGHGQALQKTGDEKVATCTSCHGHHDVRKVMDLESPVYPTRLAKTCAKCHSDPKLMADRQYHGRPLGHDQLERWQKSVHAKALLEKGDLSAPTCNDCHGNHGALPPQVGTVANACGTCHGKVAKLFSETRMKHRFEKLELPGCAACHGEHDIVMPSDPEKMLGMDNGAACVRCHAKGEYGATIAGAGTATAMRTELEGLKRQIASTKEIVARAARLGMEVRGPSYDLRKAFDSLTNARVLVHSFALKPVKASLAEGMEVAIQVQEKAQEALHEYDARRIWLAASLAPILLVIVLLLRYIRALSAPTM